jgi:predicted transposase YbfD/YdcC
MCQDDDACPELMRISIVPYFEDMPDPRECSNTTHKLLDIIVIAVCATIAGCDACTQMAEYGRRKEAWLRQVLKLELPQGIPSHDTFSRVLALLDAEKFQECFMRWAAALCQATSGKIVAIDGKTLRRSFDNANGRGAIHLVSAWCSQNHISLGQLAVDGKSNETTAIPELLELLDISGATVTIDAAGCQRAIATQIRKQKADYVLALKKNHPTLYEDVKACFEHLQSSSLAIAACDVYEKSEKGHGREEHRTVYVLPVPETIRQRGLWKDLQSICMIIGRRVVKGHEESQTRYFISSLAPNAKTLAEAVRWHWGIENSLHWVLDMSFREDDSRIRKGFGAENIATLRRLAISLLKRESTKQSIATKRLMAAWDNDYLFRVLLAAGGG